MVADTQVSCMPSHVAILEQNIHHLSSCTTLRSETGKEALSSSEALFIPIKSAEHVYLSNKTLF